MDRHRGPPTADPPATPVSPAAGKDAITAIPDIDDYGHVHPDTADDPLTLDAHSDEPQALEGVFFVVGGALSEAPVRKLEGESNDFCDYREKTLAPTALTLLGTLRPRRLARPRGEGA